MRHLVELVEMSQAPFVTVHLADGQRVVLDRKRASAKTPKILERFGVPHDRSEDLRRPARKLTSSRPRKTSLR
jgi:hypothetical protein